MPGRRAPEDARREQIVSAAYAVALRSGIAGVTLRAVAAEAGLSHGLLIFHFKGKAELVGALLDRVLATTVMRHVDGDAASSDGTRICKPISGSVVPVSTVRWVNRPPAWACAGSFAIGMVNRTSCPSERTLISKA